MKTEIFAGNVSAVVLIIYIYKICFMLKGVFVMAKAKDAAAKEAEVKEVKKTAKKATKAKTATKAAEKPAVKKEPKAKAAKEPKAKAAAPKAKEAEVKEVKVEQKPAEKTAEKANFIHSKVLNAKWFHKGEKKTRIDIPTKNGVDQWFVQNGWVKDSKEGKYLAVPANHKQNDISVKRAGAEKGEIVKDAKLLIAATNTIKLPEKKKEDKTVAKDAGKEM